MSVHDGGNLVEIAKVLREAQSDEEIQGALAGLDDVQLAAQLDNVVSEDRDRVFSLLDDQRASPVFAALRLETMSSLARRYEPSRLAALLTSLESDDLADLLGELPVEQRPSLLAGMDPERAEVVTELLRYPEDCAGGLMSPRFLAVSSLFSVGDALSQIQESDDLPSQAFYVYVVDGRNRLVGVLSLRALVTAKPHQMLQEIMFDDLVTVSPATDQERVAELASRYDLVAVPVVDRHHHLLGIVTIDDIVDVIREEATEDILRMAGAGQMLGETRSFWRSFRGRFPWLAYAAGGGMVVAFVLSGFESVMSAVPALAMFMPVVAGMGGNVGTQSSTIVVRGLAVGYVESPVLTRVIGREMLLGATLGAIYGVLVAAASSLLVPASSVSALRLAAVISLGMVGSMTIAATVGASVPLIMDRYGIDPAVSTGPFVTTAVDGLGLLFYFWLASTLYGLGV